MEIKSLTKKLVKVAASAAYVQKSGYNSHFKYSYVTEADVLDLVRKGLTEQNVFIYPSLQSVSKDGDVTTVNIKYTFADGDTGETMEIICAGSGADRSDKGIFKATTGAYKYMLLKTFMISSGDDPEATDENGKSTRGSSSVKTVEPTAKIIATVIQNSPAITAVPAKTVVPFSKKALTKATTVSTGDDI